MTDRITLTVPAKPDYFLTARLAASSVASRMGFDVNDIEDIKTAIAESLLIIAHQKKSSLISVVFQNEGDILSVEVEGIEGKAPKTEYENEDVSLSRYLIEALADESIFDENGGFIDKVHFTKKLQR